MDDDRPYILRLRNEAGEDEYVPITSFTLEKYECGLLAGDRLRLRIVLEIRNDEGEPTGELHEPGEIWTVLTGSHQDPETLWLRQADGSLHSWSDDDSVFEWFEKLPDGPRGQSDVQEQP